VPTVISVNQQIGQLNTTASTYPQRFCCGTYGGEPEAEPGSPGKRLFNGSHSSGNMVGVAAVDGDFDFCQRAVKCLLTDDKFQLELQEKYGVRLRQVTLNPVCSTFCTF